MVLGRNENISSSSSVVRPALLMHWSVLNVREGEPQSLPECQGQGSRHWSLSNVVYPPFQPVTDQTWWSPVPNRGDSFLIEAWTPQSEFTDEFWGTVGLNVKDGEPGGAHSCHHPVQGNLLQPPAVAKHVSHFDFHISHELSFQNFLILSWMHFWQLQRYLIAAIEWKLSLWSYAGLFSVDWILYTWANIDRHERLPTRHIFARMIIQCPGFRECAGSLIGQSLEGGYYPCRRECWFNVFVAGASRRSFGPNWSRRSDLWIAWPRLIIRLPSSVYNVFIAPCFNLISIRTALSERSCIFWPTIHPAPWTYLFQCFMTPALIPHPAHNWAWAEKDKGVSDRLDSCKKMAPPTSDGRDVSWWPLLGRWLASQKCWQQ